MLQAKVANVPDHMALPPAPEAASPELRALFDTMLASFLTDKVGDDDEIDASDWLAAKIAIMEHPARNGADVALKIIAALHEIGPAREAGRVVLATSDFLTNLALNMLLQAATDAASDPTAEWARRLAAFDEARKSELDYARKHGIHFDQPKEDFAVAYAAASKAVHEEDEILTEATHLAEDALMLWPSPDGSAFALKVMLAHGRCLSLYDDIILAEAQRFSGRMVR